MHISKYQKLVSFAALVLIQNSQAQQATEKEKSRIDATAEIGFTIEETQIAELLSDRCNLVSPMEMPKFEMIVPTKILNCSIGTSTTATEFLEVFVAGKKYFIRRDHVELKPNVVDRITNLTQEQREDYDRSAKIVSSLIRQRSLEAAIKEVEKTKKLGVAILSTSITDVSEYTQGTSFKIEISNPTQKTIKYIWFTVIGYNAVNDPVRDRIKGGPALTVKGIGPIEPDQSGTYDWEYMWHTDIVEYFKVAEIKIQYMDGSIRTVKDQKAATLSQRTIDTLNSKY